MSVSIRKEHLSYLIPSAIFIVVIFILNFNGLYGQDSYEYLRYSKTLSYYFSGGKQPGNFFWTVYYPLSGALLSFIIRRNVLSLQLISITSFLLSIYYIKKTIKLIYPLSDKKLSDYILIIFALSPAMLIYSQVVMTDMFCLLFIIAGFYYSLKFTKAPKQKDFLSAILFMSAAVLVRNAAAVILIIPALFLLFNFIKNFNPVTLITALLLIVIITIPEAVLKPDHGFGTLNNVWLKNWNISNVFATAFNTPEGYFEYRFPNIIYAFESFFHPAFIFAGIFLIPFIRKEDFTTTGPKQILLSIVLYAVFIAGIPFQNLRFLLLTFPFVTILFFKPFTRISDYFKTGSIKKTVVILTVIIQLLISGYMFSNIYVQNKLEKKISDYVKNYPDKTIYTFSIVPALNLYGSSNRVIDLWKERVTEFRKHSFVIFNEGNFSKQWAEKNPMINWNYLKSNYQIKRIKRFENGWEVYEIE